MKTSGYIEKKYRKKIWCKKTYHIKLTAFACKFIKCAYVTKLKIVTTYERQIEDRQLYKRIKKKVNKKNMA